MKMEEQNNSFSKNIEVIWNRNNNTRGSKSLPVIKGINIEESVIKVKKSTKSKDFSRGISNNKSNVEHAHKRVKRSLFQENKNKCIPQAPTEDIEESKDVNIHYQNLERANPVNSEDIIESSEIINLLNKKKTKKNKVHRSKNTKTRNKNKLEERINIDFYDFNASPKTVKTHKNKLEDRINIDFYDFNASSKTVKTHKNKLEERINIDFYDFNASPKTVKTHKNKLEDRINIDFYDFNASPKTVKTHKNKLEERINIDFYDFNASPKTVKTHKNKLEDRINIDFYDFNASPKTVKTHKNKLEERINIDFYDFNASPKTVKTHKNELRGTNNFDFCSLICTDNILKSPRSDFRIKNSRKKFKPLIKEPSENQNLGITNNEINRYRLDTYSVSAPTNSKTFDEKMSQKDFRTVENSYNANDLKIDQNKSKYFTQSSEITVIPATPEHNAVNMSRSAIEYSPDIGLNSIVPLIEVDQSPKTPHGKSHNLLIQSIQTPPQNKCSIILQGLFESVTSPTQSFINQERLFKIDTMESPSAVSEYEDIFDVEMCKNKTKGSPSPNRFDSAKKRRKICKDGLRGKFRDLINRKKSEACIREYEKNLSKSYQLKKCETALLYVIEAWKEFRTFVLLCYHMNSETEVQKLLVTLENCPKNVTKNSIIRIYPPWLTIKSGNTGILLFIGVIHIEVVEFSGSTGVLEPIGLFTNVKGLLTTVFQNEVLWECNCSKENACECLGELSSFNYLKYMIS